jgi:hypothetical protein
MPPEIDHFIYDQGVTYVGKYMLSELDDCIVL